VSTHEIRAVRARRLTAPMPRPWVPAEPRLHLIVVEVEDSSGAIGTGFSWTPTIGAAPVVAMLEQEISPFVIGKTTDPRTLWPLLWARLHEAGGAGVTTIAMAGLDTALWDLAGRRSDATLPELLGRRRDCVAVYGSGVNLHYPIDELSAQAQRWVDHGYDTVKIKVGSPDLADDIARVRAVREIVGPDRTLLIDANQRWDLERATEAMRALEAFDPGWIEEPLRSEDTRGYVALRRAIGTPIALGENVHTIHRFRDIIDAGFADILQPNVVRVGGITPFLDIADLITASPATLAPHLLVELSGQLALSLDADTAVEDVEDADLAALGLLASPTPIVIRGTRLHENPSRSPGLGLDFVAAIADPSPDHTRVTETP